MPDSSEPDMAEFERRDSELGRVIQAWSAEVGSGSVEVQGPLEAVGMDPTWIVRVRGEHLEAEACLFLGPYLDVAAYRPSRPDLGAFVGGVQGLVESRLRELLTDLLVASEGGPLPTWLRSTGP